LVYLKAGIQDFEGDEGREKELMKKNGIG